MYLKAYIQRHVSENIHNVFSLGLRCVCVCVCVCVEGGGRGSRQKLASNDNNNNLCENDLHNNLIYRNVPTVSGAIN